MASVVMQRRRRWSGIRLPLILSVLLFVLCVSSVAKCDEVCAGDGAIVEGLQGELEGVKAQVEGWKRKEEERAQEVETLKARLAEMESQAIDSEELVAAQKEIEEVRARAEEEKAEIERNAEEALDKMRGELDEKSKRMDEMEDTLRQVNSKLEEEIQTVLAQQVTETQKTKALEEELRETRATHEKVLQELKDDKHQIEVLQGLREEESKALEGLREDLQRLRDAKRDKDEEREVEIKQLRLAIQAFESSFGVVAETFVRKAIKRGRAAAEAGVEFTKDFATEKMPIVREKTANFWATAITYYRNFAETSTAAFARVITQAKVTGAEYYGKASTSIGPYYETFLSMLGETPSRVRVFFSQAAPAVLGMKERLSQMKIGNHLSNGAKFLKAYAIEAKQKLTPYMAKIKPLAYRAWKAASPMVRTIRMKADDFFHYMTKQIIALLKSHPATAAYASEEHTAYLIPILISLLVPIAVSLLLSLSRALFGKKKMKKIATLVKGKGAFVPLAKGSSNMGSHISGSPGQSSRRN